ncbi:lytic murein transglycosylase [Oceanidesulfovibrio indonesiensis]|uniref:Lytic murein transglycosylase n=1 Tax=Oceanidesulfovibrio indonesiensis TaxID=54767 RepID=A0A7M3ME83_9BACT|nr:lytic murein transglycosylase [Oceanidesulfovibrio indonesiensis]TVM17130.1 lytic murein transglycosylase [Oceanidesulfovibrio indonesiensis]
MTYHIRQNAALTLGLLLTLLCAGSAHAMGRDVPSLPPRWESLAEKLIRDGLPGHQVTALFRRGDVLYKSEFMGKKIRALSRTKYGVPAREPEPVKEIAPTRRDKRSLYDVHLTPDRLAAVRVFYQEHELALSSVEQRFGTPRQLVMAILVVETRLGEYLGEQSAFNSLASMAATRSLGDIAAFLPETLTTEQRQYLTRRTQDKADWAYTQLKALIRFSEQSGLDPVAMPGSIYGAIGLCQFIPTTALERGVDGDGDGCVDLYNPADAVHSVGNFLRKAGWKSGLSSKQQVQVVRRYNNDEYYARTVLRLASLL